jgi:hypothetical protein
MKRVFDGAFRLDRARKADSNVRFRASMLDTARSFNRISDKALRSSRMGATAG